MLRVIACGVFVLSCAPGALGFFADPGFESYAVADGGVLFDNGGPWAFENNARVVDAFAPNSGTPDTYSATFAPFEGEQYTSTYGGLDRIVQDVYLTPGSYTVSVYAAAPDGEWIHPVSGPLTLVDGGFDFVLDGANVSLENVLSPGTDWTHYFATFSIDTEGVYEVGVRNTRTAVYFINYDGFGLVPGPGVAGVFGLGLVLGAGRRRRV